MTANAYTPDKKHLDRAPTALVLLLGSLMAFGPLTIDTYLPAFPAISDDFGADAAAVQKTLSVYFAGLAIGQIAYGPLADRFGRRIPLLGGIALYVIAAIGCATAPSLNSLVAWRFAQALGGCSGMVITRAVVRDLFEPREMARVFSQLVLVMGIAPILAPLLGSWLLAAFGWRGIFWTLAAFGTACITAQAFALKESLPVSVRTQAGLGEIVSTYFKLLIDPRFLAPVVGSGLLWATMFVYIGGAPFLYMELHGVSPSNFGILFGINAAGMIATSQINAVLLKSKTPGQLLRFGSSLTTLAALGLMASIFTEIGGIAGIACMIFLMMAGLGFVGGNASAAAMAPFARTAGSASALMGTVQFTLGAAAGAAAAAMFNGTGQAVAIVITVLAITGTIIVFGWRVAGD